MTSYASSLWTAGTGLVHGVIATVAWVTDYWPLLVLVGVVTWIGLEAVRTHLADKASRERTAVRLVASKTFEPDSEQIWRYATLLSRVAMSGPWWAPRRSRTARLRMTADGREALDFQVEGPASADHLLGSTPYRGVKVVRAAPVRTTKKAKYSVRAEFVMRGSPAKQLREVPLDPDPLQPLVDALAGLRSDLGERVEICLDMQRIPVWQLQLRRWRLLLEARQKAIRAAQQDQNASLQVEESWRAALANLFSPSDERPRTRISVPPRPRPVDRAKVLGKLQEPAGLVRVQILVRSLSSQPGRAEERLGLVSAAFDVFAGTNRLIHTGQQLGPLRIGPDHWLFRKSFDKRWAKAQIKGNSSWVRTTEIAGLLKPPTVHCVLPVLSGQVPTYVPGSASAERMMVHGWYAGPDGKDRLLGTWLSETLFSLRVGKSTYGKTQQALCQFVGLAHSGVGGMFVDPHGDSLREAAVYLAHEPIKKRLLFFDLTGQLGDQALLGTWNILSLERGQRPEEVTHAVTDAIAGTLGWNDATHPRAMTLLTKSVELLIAVNVKAMEREKPEQQATLFQIRTVLTDPAWRHQILRSLDERVSQWWETTFPTFPPDAFTPVVNPLERLYSNPVTRAFLGNPTSSLDFRAAMDEGKLIWICPSASGPTDRLLLSLLFADFLRAGLSRRDLKEKDRRPFHAFIDELISIDATSSNVIAQVSEELRKFGIRLHAMTQLLQRVSVSTRESLMQNASVISSTAGSFEAVGIVAKEWGSVHAAEIANLSRYEHYITLTVRGQRVGPLLIRGPQLSELYKDLARPGEGGSIRAASDENINARPQEELCTAAENRDAALLKAIPVELSKRKGAKGRAGDAMAPQGANSEAPHPAHASSLGDDKLPISHTDA